MIKENREATEPRTGMYTTALVANTGERTICLYFAGRPHAGENLAEILALREANRGPPIVMSDALSVNALADETAIIRSHCLAHGRRKFASKAPEFTVLSHSNSAAFTGNTVLEQSYYHHWQ